MMFFDEDEYRVRTPDYVPHFKMPRVKTGPRPETVSALAEIAEISTLEQLRKSRNCYDRTGARYVRR